MARRKVATGNNHLSYPNVRGLLMLAAGSVTILTAVAAVMALFEKLWFDYTVSQYYFLITGGVMFLAALFILFEIRGHTGIQSLLKEDFNVWMAGSIIYLIPGIWAAVIENHRKVEAEYIDNGLSKFVDEYTSVPEALAASYNHTFWAAVLVSNTVFFSAVFLPKYVTPFFMGLCNPAYRSGSKNSESSEMI